MMRARLAQSLVTLALTRPEGSPRHVCFRTRVFKARPSAESQNFQQREFLSTCGECARVSSFGVMHAAFIYGKEDGCGYDEVTLMCVGGVF